MSTDGVDKTGYLPETDWPTAPQTFDQPTVAEPSLDTVDHSVVPHPAGADPIDRVHSLFARVASEFFGTFLVMLAIFVTIGARARGMVGAIELEISRYAATGLAVAAVVAGFDTVSAHFNPAVSLAHAVSKKLSWRDFGLYAVAQLVASWSAAVSASYLIGGKTSRAIPNASRVSTSRTLVLELIASAVVITMYLATHKRLRHVRPVFVGGSVMAASLVIGRATTLGLNPARTLGPALWDRFGTTTWIFIVAPLAAGLIVGLCALLAEDSDPNSLLLRGLAEFVGSFGVFFVGLAGIRSAGGVVAAANFYLGPPIAILALGVLLRTRTYFNPAATLAMMLAKRLRLIEGLTVVAAQSAGAILAVVGLKVWLREQYRPITSIHPIPRIGGSTLFLLELIASIVLLAVVVRRGSNATGPAFVAGATLAMVSSLAYFGRSYLNPAWAIGTATGSSNGKSSLGLPVGWDMPTLPSHLPWLVGGPVVAAVIVGLATRFLPENGRKPKPTQPTQSADESAATAIHAAA
jgi:glycerol uptake facilitator-like aquaporin